jgi:two-component system LytT family response regulator
VRGVVPETKRRGPGTANAIRVVVADDERPARAKLLRYLAAESDVEVVGEAAGGVEAVAAIRATTPDLVFLDVQMPDLDGFGVVEELGGDPAPHVVFVTAHDTYAVRAFEVRALDYLLKPVGPDRFAAVLGRAREAVRRGAAPDFTRLLEEVRAKRPTRILVQSGERGVLVDVERIDRVEADRNYVTLFVGPEAYRLRGTLEALERRLDRDAFVRVNRSTIVRVGAIKEVQPWFHGEYRIVLADGATITWTRTYLDRVGDVFLTGL